MPAAITCAGLSFYWPDGTPVLNGLTMALGPGRTGLVGVNGSGKSTLLRRTSAWVTAPGGYRAGRS